MAGSLCRGQLVHGHGWRVWCGETNKKDVFSNMRFRLFLLVSAVALLAAGLVSCDKTFMRDGVNYELNNEGATVVQSK